MAIAAIAVVTLIPIGIRPATSFSPNVERFCVMAIVGGLFAIAYPRWLWTVIFALIGTAAFLEPLQFFALGRHPSIRDVIVKSAGAGAGAITGYVLSCRAVMVRLKAKGTKP